MRRRDQNKEGEKYEREKKMVNGTKAEDSLMAKIRDISDIRLYTL